MLLLTDNARLNNLTTLSADFRVVVSQLRPDLASRLAVVADTLGTARLREAVAPVYLRRTRADVLDDLPLLP